VLEEKHKVDDAVTINKHKGNFGEKILSNVWPQYFEHDDVKLVGNAGNEDLMVTPFLNSGINNYGCVSS
jgi:hypothetical protein